MFTQVRNPCAHPGVEPLCPFTTVTVLCTLGFSSAYLWWKNFKTRTTFFLLTKVRVAISQKVPVNISPHFQGFWMFFNMQYEFLDGDIFAPLGAMCGGAIIYFRASYASKMLYWLSRFGFLKASYSRSGKKIITSYIPINFVFSVRLYICKYSLCLIIRAMCWYYVYVIGLIHKFHFSYVIWNYWKTFDCTMI